MSQIVDYHKYRPLLDCFVKMVQDTLIDRVVSIVLYGSVARGEAKTESDVDLLLVIDEASPVYRERLQLLIPILRRLRQQSCWKELEIQRIFSSPSVIILSREEADQNRLLYLDMIEDAQILFDRDGFFQNRLNILQHRLHQLGARKIYRDDDDWYWDLKPDLERDEALIL